MTVGHDRDEVEEILASMRAAGDAIAAARAEFASVTFGEKILYGTRSKLCMALGLGTDASGIAIVDAVRAVIRERDDRRRERDEARAIVDRCAAALRRTVPEMATRGGPCLPEEVEHAVSSALHFRDEARAERDALRVLVASAGAVISEIGCECACAHSTEEDHDDDCDPCSVCRIADALQPTRGAR